MIFKAKEFDSLAQIHKILICYLKLSSKPNVYHYRYISQRQTDFMKKFKKLKHSIRNQFWSFLQQLCSSKNKYGYIFKTYNTFNSCINLGGHFPLVIFSEDHEILTVRIPTIWNEFVGFSFSFIG